MSMLNHRLRSAGPAYSRVSLDNRLHTAHSGQWRMSAFGIPNRCPQSRPVAALGERPLRSSQIWPPRSGNRERLRDRVNVRLQRESMMFEYRITKYDPAYRDVAGAYTRDEWTSVSDVGRSFEGTPLTKAEYKRVENAYVASALEFLRESNVRSLAVRGLENYRGALLAFGEGDAISLEKIEPILSQVLREEFWCKLEGPNSFIHVGYEYYMYIGVPSPCPKSEQRASSLGLFVEPFQSPYGDQDAA